VHILAYRGKDEMDKPTLVKVSVADAIGQAFKENGVEYFFYVMGGGSAGLREWEETMGITPIMCRNEMAATNMADGCARVTKKPTVCYGQHGAAAAILASMMYEPMAAHSPVIAITGATPTSRKDQWTYQECYELPYFQSTCKFNVDVTDANRVAEYVRTAIQIAVSGCPGPTHVNIHQDMWSIVTEMPKIYGDTNFRAFPPFRMRAEQGKVVEAAKLLANTENPVMLCGSGIHWSDAYDEVRELAELLAIPVATVYGGKGCFPEDHPLYIGTIGAYGRPVTNAIVREADLVFFAATRAGRHHTQNFTAPLPSTSKIIHLDIDPIAIGRNYKVAVALVGDAKATLQDLVTTLKTMIAKPKPRGQRLREIAKRIKAYENSVTPEGTDKVNSDAIPIWPQRIVHEVSKFMNPRDIVVSDTGNMMSYTTLFLKLNGVGHNYIPVSGTLGSSFALAIGVSFGAAEDQRVIHMTGDGGMGYTLADIETSVRYNDLHVPMVTIVNHNRIVGSWRVQFAPTSFTKIFEGFGGYGILVEQPGEIQDALTEAFNSGKPAVVDIITEPSAHSRMGAL
jgi:acetolactate synthase-1/2/3 large subunit